MAVSRTKIVMIAAMIVLFAAVGSSAGDNVMFSYEFKAGTSHDYEVKSTQEIDFSGMAFNTIGDFQVTEKCVSVEAGVASMELVFNKVDVSLMMFGQMQDDPTQGKLVNQVIAFKIDAAGKVTDIEPAGYIENWAQLQQVVKPVIEGSYMNMPGKAVAVGETWKYSDDGGEDGMKVKSQYDFVFKEMKKEGERNCASVEGTLNSELGGSMQLPMGEMNAGGEGKGSLKVLFDPADKIIVAMEVRSENKIDMVPAAGGDTQAMTVNFEMKKTLKK